MKMPTANVIRAIFVLVLAVLLGSQLALSSFAWRLFEGALLPEMDRKASTIGLSVQARLLSAVAQGVPFNRLEGVEDFFSLTRANNPDLAFLALAGADGAITYAAGADRVVVARVVPSGLAATPARRVAEDGGTTFVVTSFPLVHEDERLGVLHVGISQRFIAARVSEIRLDILTVVATSLLAAFELLMFIMSASLQQPLRHIWSTLRNVANGDFREIASVRASDLGGLAERVNKLALGVNARAATLMSVADRLRLSAPARRIDEALERLRQRFHFAWDGQPRIHHQSQAMQIRILTFLFMFAEQLSRPFLPLMVKDILPAWAGQGGDVLVGMPITAFMLVVALGMPVAGRWIEKAGASHAFRAGAAAMVVGLVGAAAPLSIYDFTFWRMVTAAGYATMFMACQAFVLDNTNDEDRARGVSLFVGAIMMAEICAPAIGGILADRVGYGPVFLLGAAIAVTAAFLGQTILRRHDPSPSSRGQGRGGLSGMMVGLRNARFVVLLLFAAVPAKLMLTGFLFYLVPVVLTQMNVGQADIGRIVMAYGLPGLTLMPVFSALADRFKCHGLMVGLGGMIAGLCLLPVLFHEDRTLVILGVAGLGVGQAMSIAPQLALVTEVCRDEIERHGSMAVIGLYRLVERFGAAMGALVAGTLTAVVGPVEAMAILGAGCFVCAVVFSTAFLMLGARPEVDLPDDIDAVDTAAAGARA